jgi:hypothetical protein
MQMVEVNGADDPAGVGSFAAQSVILAAEGVSKLMGLNQPVFGVNRSNKAKRGLAMRLLPTAQPSLKSSGVLFAKLTEIRVVSLAKLVYNQTSVFTPTKPSPDRAIGRRQKGER